MRLAATRSRSWSTRGSTPSESERWRNEATGAALIVVDGSGDNQIAVGAGANAALGPDDVRRALEGALEGAGCLLVSLEVPHEAVRTAAELGLARRIPVIVDPAPARPSALELAALGPIFTPNAGEARRLTGERIRGGRRPCLQT